MDVTKSPNKQAHIDLEAAFGALGMKPQMAKGPTRREMDSISAVADTLLPNCIDDVPDDDGGADDRDVSIRTFYRTSASMLGTPEAVGNYMLKMHHSMIWLLRVVLWLLSTWFGAFFVCGAMNVSTRFPYVHKFSNLDPRRREKIILWWANNPFYILRELFRSLKYITTLSHFSQVNEKQENPTWKALGYCGSDPEHIKHQILDGDNDDRLGPLHRAVVYMQKYPRDTLSSHLSKVGLSLTTQPPLHNHNNNINILSNKLAHQKPLLKIQCDAVIVGSGSGGGVVAGVLARAGYKVVVLEKGNYHARSNLTLLEGPTLNKMYEGGGLLATTDTGVIILAGSTVGGGSTVNWSASLRTPNHVISEWRKEHGLELFGSDAYEAALEAVCDRMGVQQEVAVDNLNNSVLRRGCNDLGYPVKNIPRNSDADHYCGWCCFGCSKGKKKGTCETWLVDMAESGNGVILPGCRAVKVLHADKGRKRNVATGVLFEYDNAWSGEKENCIVESKVTVVAGGALNTPVLLKRSGLRNSNIGKNLHLHPVVMTWGYFPVTESNKKSYEGGIMTAMSPIHSKNSGTDDDDGYGAIIQTPSLHPGMFSVLMPWTSGSDFKKRMTRFANTAHVFTLARDRGSGSIDSSGYISYEMDGTDEDNLKRGVEKMLRIVTAAGAAEIGTHHCKGDRLDVKSASSHQFEKFVKKASGRGLRNLSTPICSAHQMGSCRMGVNPETSAVDKNGETWEVEGLYVADASVFPTALGVNPMVTVQAIAYCTAQSVVEVLRRKIKIS